jgi:hypothetical protein
MVDIAFSPNSRSNFDQPDSPDSDESDNEGDIMRPIPVVDLLGKVRSLIKAIRASGQRQTQFYNVVESGNRADWWKDANGNPEKIKPLKFLHDVKTRWDSTYQMLIRLRMFKQVNIIPCSCFCSLLTFYQPLDQFLSLDSSKDIAKFKLSAEEWVRITEFIIQVGHIVLQVISPESKLIRAYNNIMFQADRS